MECTCSILSPVAYPLCSIFPLYVINAKSRKNKLLEGKMWVLILSTTFVWNISHSKNNWVRYVQKRILFFTWSTRFSRHILMKLQFLYSFSKTTQILNFIKIRPNGAQLFHANERMDRQIWRWQSLSANFAKARNKFHDTRSLAGIVRMTHWDNMDPEKNTHKSFVWRVLHETWKIILNCMLVK